jgi:hypothetical protein
MSKCLMHNETLRIALSESPDSTVCLPFRVAWWSNGELFEKTFWDRPVAAKFYREMEYKLEQKQAR